MADEQAVYEAIAQAMRDYGYRDVTAAVAREIDEGPPTEERQGVISTFATRQPPPGATPFRTVREGRHGRPRSSDARELSPKEERFRSPEETPPIRR